MPRHPSVWSLWASERTVAEDLASKTDIERPTCLVAAGGRTPRLLLANAPIDRLILTPAAPIRAVEVVLVVITQVNIRLVGQAIAGRSALSLTSLIAANRVSWRVFWSR